MKAMEDYYEGSLHKAVLVSSDGDYAPLVHKFRDVGAFEAIISPAENKKCSILLKKLNVKIVYLSDKRTLLEQK
jgi:uncharacterized LabA/DUF88 family protein